MKIVRINLWLLLVSLIVFNISCKKQDPGSQLPVVTTTAVSSITSISAATGGYVASAGNSDVTNRGICFSSKPNPTISDNSISSGAGLGDFSIKISGLTASVTYYVRAFASNASGTAYGNQEIFTATNIPVAPIDPVSNIYINGTVNLYAFDGRNGTLKWTVTPEKDALDLYISSPAYADGKIYLCGNQNIYCYDTTGTLSWATAYPAPVATPVSPWVANGLVYVIVNGALCAYNADNGSLAWQFATLPGAPEYGSPLDEILLKNGVLYANSAYFLRALNPATGAQVWSYKKIEVTSRTPIAVNAGSVYLFSDTLYVVDANTGMLQWKKGGYYYLDRRAVNVGNGKIYSVGDNQDLLDAYDINSASPVFSITTNLFTADEYYEYAAMPVLDDSIAYLSMYPISATYAHNANTGKFLFEVKGNDPTIINQTLYTTEFFSDVYGADWCNLNCIDIATLQYKWRSKIKEYRFSAPCIVTTSGKVYRLGELIN